MIPIKRILLALDLTDMDVQLMQYARYLSTHLPELEAIYFMHNIKHADPELMDELLDDLDKPLNEFILEDIEEKVTEVFGDSINELTSQVVIEQEESTAHAIVDTADSYQADIILTGKKIDSTGSGIVPAKLLHLNTHAILFLPETAYHQIQKILVPTDFSEASIKAMKMALHIRKEFDSKLSCQHVYHIPMRYFPYIPVESTHESMRDAAENDFREFLTEVGAEEDIDCVFTPGKNKSIVKNIHLHAMRQNVSLVVIGDKGHTMFVGSVADGLSNLEMHIPLLVVSSG